MYQNAILREETLDSGQAFTRSAVFQRRIWERKLYVLSVGNTSFVPCKMLDTAILNRPKGLSVLPSSAVPGEGRDGNVTLRRQERFFLARRHGKEKQSDLGTNVGVRGLVTIVSCKEPFAWRLRIRGKKIRYKRGRSKQLFRGGRMSNNFPAW